MDIASVVADLLQLFLILATGVVTTVWADWKPTSKPRAD
jgi:hypothetical protein